MGLAISLIIKILIELPIIALFFKRKKRESVLLMALAINIISWLVAHILFFSTDINIYYIATGLGIGEAIAFYILLEYNWKKMILLALIVNSLSFFVMQHIPVDMEIFQSKPEINVMQSGNY